MLRTLALRGFRGFASYRLTGLSRVNLLVGKNNCGKTSILEAIELLVSEGNLGILYRSLQRRDGMGTRRRRGDSRNISHLFHGHTCTPGASFELLSNDGKGTLKARIVPLEGDEIADQFDPDEDIPVLGMNIERGDHERKIQLKLMDDGTIRTGYRHHYILMRNRYSGAPIHFLTLDDFDPASMGRIWNSILKSGIESQIISDMKLLEPRINSIHFLTSAEQILIGHDDGRRLPISTYGDGTKRLLALRLSLSGAEGGVLLADEIDTGLHWTVMEEMWDFVIKVARRLNVQIFATTHSYDCIRGLGSLIRNQPELENEMSLQKVDRLLPEAVRLTGDQIRIAVKQDIEVR